MSAEISIIIPVYNSEKYVEACFASLRNQSFTNWEAIVIDDGSIDNSSVIIDRYGELDQRFKIFHKKNEGVSAARNDGISYSSGKRVMFLDSDDQLASETLEELIQIVDDFDYDVVAWALRTDGESPSLFPMCQDYTFAIAPSQELEDLRLRAFTGYSVNGKKDQSMHFAVTKLIKKSFLIEHGLSFNANLKYHEDTLFTVQVMDKAQSAVAVNKYYYIRSQHEGSATVRYCDSIKMTNKTAIQAFSKHVELYHPNQLEYEVALWKYKLAWIVQILKLDIMNEKANYTKQERLGKIAELLSDDSFFIPLFRAIKNLPIKQTVFAAIIHLRLKGVVYLLHKYL